MRGLLTEAIISCSCASESRKSCEVREAVDDEGSRGETGTEGFGLRGLAERDELGDELLVLRRTEAVAPCSLQGILRGDLAGEDAGRVDVDQVTRRCGSDRKTGKGLRAAPLAAIACVRAGIGSLRVIWVKHSSPMDGCSTMIDLKLARRGKHHHVLTRNHSNKIFASHITTSLALTNLLSYTIEPIGIVVKKSERHDDEDVAICAEEAPGRAGSSGRAP